MYLSTSLLKSWEYCTESLSLAILKPLAWSSWAAVKKGAAGQGEDCRRHLQYGHRMGGVPVTHLLDTHVWIRRALGLPLPSLVDKILAESAASFALADVSLWEAAKLIEFGRLQLAVPLAEFFRLALTPELTVLPVTAARLVLAEILS